ncbi:PB1 domain [Musa troglodytarum]|uniref:PB1 domain n=1 Tax=Musa troglodytarum TaxID=320322 RepID=A0A9E7KCQ5_9LILI|nr:PB1 domain [Musa troglodytarum]
MRVRMKTHGHHRQSADAESSSAAGSTASTPRAATAAAAGGGGHVLLQRNHIPHHPPPPHPARCHPDDPSAPLVRLMCSYGGRILPRPHDDQLRYVGGETRIVAVPRSASFAALRSRLSELHPAAAGGQPPCLKYQLPHEDLDALVSLTSDEDVENMFDECDRLALAGVQAPRLRLFLFPPPTGAFGSVVDVPGFIHGQWFVDALKCRASCAASGLPSLERDRSEASSTISEVPDYLFGVDTNSGDPPLIKPEAGSTFPASSQPSAPPVPDLPPVKTKMDVEEVQSITIEPIAQHKAQLVPHPMWSYTPEPVPVFFVPPSFHGRGKTTQPVPFLMPVQYMHPLGPMAGGQVPMWFRQPSPVQGAPAYMGGPPMLPGASVGGGYEYPAEPYEVPARSLLIPVNRATGVPLAGGAVPAAENPERRSGRALR